MLKQATQLRPYSFLLNLKYIFLIYLQVDGSKILDIPLVATEQVFKQIVIGLCYI